MASLLRTGATRSLLRTLNTTSNQTTTFRTRLHTLSRRPHIFTPKTLALTRWQSGRGRAQVDQVDKEREERLRSKTLRPTPDSVSTSSTILPSMGIENPRSGAPEEDPEPKMMSGIASDLVRMRCTFSRRACDAENHVKMGWVHKLTTGAIANHPRYFLPPGCATPSLLHGHGRCRSLCCDFLEHCLLRL